MCLDVPMMPLLIEHSQISEECCKNKREGCKVDDCKVYVCSVEFELSVAVHT